MSPFLILIFSFISSAIASAHKKDLITCAPLAMFDAGYFVNLNSDSNLIVREYHFQEIAKVEKPLISATSQKSQQACVLGIHSKEKNKFQFTLKIVLNEQFLDDKNEPILLGYLDMLTSVNKHLKDETKFPEDRMICSMDAHFLKEKLSHCTTSTLVRYKQNESQDDASYLLTMLKRWYTLKNIVYLSQ